MREKLRALDLKAKDLIGPDQLNYCLVANQKREFLAE